MAQPSITITGALGSGKSTVAKHIAQILGYKYYSTGEAQRKIADQMGLTTLELNAVANKDSSIDKKIDAVFQDLNVSSEPFIVDSRLAWFFMPSSFKVKLIVENNIAAKRIFNDTKRSSEQKYSNIQESLDALLKRRAFENKRFMETYHIDIENESNFDLIIDTSHLTPEEICKKIIQKYKAEI